MARDETLTPTERVILTTKATGIREAAAALLAGDIVFDDDHDNALVAARLHEIADRYDETSGFSTK